MFYKNEKSSVKDTVPTWTSFLKSCINRMTNSANTRMAVACFKQTNITKNNIVR